ncbi:alpha-E domain-containing protein [Acetobacter sp. AN02]|uniref:alpha-E domain-containing protein n=1 Tax=Acetobacter sp. AN02 TaxID=2894186 RepID=UPI0024345398|nr:alpha-E domain-containing protein [Acetobacter sp. AN02]MDG6093753.1 alpha-E domain-containing protein [Acetobacter sp. AN02]
MIARTTTDPVSSAPPQPLLSRYAESAMWLARYMERIENLARLIDVTETFVRSGARSGWDAIIQINADVDRFRENHAEASAERVISFYVTDADNPNSISSLSHAVRENARALRPLISTEMWTHLNIFTKFLRGLKAEDIRPSVITQLCAKIKQECQTHAGITEGTFYRDQCHAFYQAGRYLERADQITRLIDIKYHTLLPSPSFVGSQVDISQWTSVLRSAAGYHAYRRVMSSDMSPESVTGFLLKSQAFPRSLATNLRMLHVSISRLRTDYGLKASGDILEALEFLRAGLDDQSSGQIILRGLHEFLDWVQCRLQDIQAAIARGFWPGTEEDSAPAAEGAGERSFSGAWQSQGQS